MGNQKFGIDPNKIQQYAKEVKHIINMGGEIAVVIGGGNIHRGVVGNSNSKLGVDFIDRFQGDYMGMLSTVINSIAFKAVLENLGVEVRLQTSIRMEPIAELYVKNKAIKHLEKGRVVIFGAGIGNPYFTTDTAAILRAIETKCQVILKGTNVDGIYTSDPKKDINAIKINNISFKEVYYMRIRVMDLTAFTLSFENNLPIIVFNINKKNNLKKVIFGESIGTLVS